MDDSCSADKKRASSWPGRSSEPQRQGHPGRQERCLLLQRQSEQTFPWRGDFKLPRREDVSCESPVSQGQGQKSSGWGPSVSPLQKYL